jgi:hypothetical protein
VKGVVGRCALVAVVAVGVGATATAAERASGDRILVLEAGDLFTVDQDGGDRRRLTFDGRVVSPAGSPNGARIAFLKSDGSSPRDLYVMNADGTGGARLIATHPETTNAGGIRGIAWSPDSRRLAYFLTFATPAIRVVDAGDGAPLPLPQDRDPRPFAALEWSPDGSELLYDDGGDIWIKPVDGGPARRVVDMEGQDTRATWSPDGTQIAWIHSSSQAAGGVYVVRRDGTGLRHVVATGTAILGTVRWRPDGRTVVFDATVVEGVGPRNVPLATSRILAAATDRAVIDVLRDHVAGPIQSPDGGQILVEQAYRVFEPGYEALKPGVHAMNADGTCLTLVTSGLGVGWQRARGGSATQRRECVDLVLTAKTTGPVGLRGVSYSLAVQNQGTLTAHDVRLVQRFGSEVSIFIGRSSQRFCSASAGVVTCRADAMSPRTTLAVAILARPRAAGALDTSVFASAAERDADPATNDAAWSTRVYPCWIAGTDFPDTLVGTRAGEEICARAGADTVHARGGADVVDGGWHADTLHGGAGRDRLIGGRGDDTILARDGERDTVECGLGDDRAVVDRKDRVLRGCEHVLRG